MAMLFIGQTRYRVPWDFLIDDPRRRRGGSARGPAAVQELAVEQLGPLDVPVLGEVLERARAAGFAHRAA